MVKVSVKEHLSLSSRTMREAKAVKRFADKVSRRKIELIKEIKMMENVYKVQTTKCVEFKLRKLHLSHKLMESLFGWAQNKLKEHCGLLMGHEYEEPELGKDIQLHQRQQQKLNLKQVTETMAAFVATAAAEKQ